MSAVDEFLGAKDFSFFIPSLLEDIDIQELLKAEFDHLDVEKIIREGDPNDDFFDFIFEVIIEGAVYLEGIEVNLNEDGEPSEYNIYGYNIRGMKGIFFTEACGEGDDETLFYDSLEKAITSIEINFDVELENNKVDRKSLEKRMTATEAIIRVLNIMKRDK